MQANANASTDSVNVISEESSHHKLLQVEPKLTKWGVYTNSGLKNEIYSWFIASEKTSANNSYVLSPNENVRQSWVRLTEGNYDSGKKWCSAAASTADKKMYETPKVSRTNDPFQTAYSSW